jgi:hypothetical protein
MPRIDTNSGLPFLSSFHGFNDEGTLCSRQLYILQLGRWSLGRERGETRQLFIASWYEIDGCSQMIHAATGRIRRGSFPPLAALRYLEELRDAR